MILGVGVDLVKTEKIERAIKRWGNDFIKRIFNDYELKNISPGKIYYQRLAARFAAKEAVIKATSKLYSLSLRDIIILNKDNGAPYCKIKNDRDINIFISLTHLEDYAVACAVAEKASRYP